MFPFEIRPEDAMAEIVELNRKVLKGIDSIVDVRDVDVSPTPKEVVYKEDELVLYHFEPKVKRPCKVPILIVYALVNRPYMVDLQEGRSMVSNLLKQGMDVYLIDWGYPDPFERYLNLDDYVNGYIDTCVDVLRRRHGLDQINLLGICQGGTMSLCYTSLHPEKIKNLITMVTPVDFHVKGGLLNVWARSLDVDTMVEAFGNVPGEFMNFGFLMLKPLQLMVQKYLGFVSLMDDENNLKSFLRMEKWIFDSPDQAGEAFRQFIKDFFQGNKLVKGEVELGGKKVDLKNITMPVFNLYATEDHLVPPASSMSLEKFVGSTDVTTVPFPGGHIGIYVSSRSQKELAPALAKWVKDRV
ncbi:MAG: class III poly(R)-hydroxyalkanoic acid synthase subunit PhaC [Deltaproteobacteria bacterium]|nr:class III poly(R)-hydroxyalkanoic acid synthase subunit PhaC [Deltaproteobacteria bacterium]